MVVIGTRPEAIKLAPVVPELERHRAHFETKICVTGQHREMLDQMLRVFGLRPDYDLGVMKAGQDLAEATAACLTGPGLLGSLNCRWSWVALRLGFHQSFIDHVPEPVAVTYRRIRKSWYANRFRLGSPPRTRSRKPVPFSSECATRLVGGRGAVPLPTSGCG